jgi:RHS repeat-associated protein
MILDHPDNIGSLRVVSYCGGGGFSPGSFARHPSLATRHCSHERLFYPFGEMWQGSDPYSLGMHQTFGKLPDYDNDSNSDLYNTLNWHYTPMGRWLSPDPGGLNAVRLDDPQTWNMYAYVRNNPTTLTDPTGLIGYGFWWYLKRAARLLEPPQPPAQNATAAQNQTEKVDKDKVADYMDKHANGTDTYGGHCARACHDGLQAGGVDISDRPASGAAKDNGPFLTDHGATVVVHGDTVALPADYKPQKGDVAVFEGGKGRYQYGHMRIYDGKQWVSDTKQSGFSPNRNYWPGGYKIYRFPD